MTPTRAVSLSDISALAELIKGGHEVATKRVEELRVDLEAKHRENREGRHAQNGLIGNLQGENHLIRERLTRLESTVKTIVGDDNDGGSGLLHEIKDKVEELQRRVYGAIAIVAFLGFIVPIVVGIILWVLKH